MKPNLEIERKWMVHDWPHAGLPLVKEERMRQGYITTDPTVRIREEARTGGETHYILCFKSHGLLTRKEIEIEITKEEFAQLEDLIGLPLIPKVRRTYRLPDGQMLEVNHVDKGQPTEFFYAEIEFPSEEKARAFDPTTVELQDYLNDDVTDQPGQSMAAYWCQTRLDRHA